MSQDIKVHGNTIEVPYLTEMNSVFAQYGFALAILRRDTNIVAFVSDEHPDQKEGGVFGTEVASTLIEWRNGIYSSVLNFFNNQDSLG